MQITRIELLNFRNHEHLVLDKVGKVLVIVGDNAAGKTNIIEALQLITMHESFRRPAAEELHFREMETEAQSLISVDITILDTQNTKQISFKENSRVFFYNKKERPARELIDLVPAVLFTPDDLQIVKGPPEQRRDLLDNLGSRLSKSFSQIRSEYTKALRQKNSLLKQDEVDLGVLDSWNTNLAKLGSSLSKHRRRLFEQLIEEAAEVYEKISGGEVLAGTYRALWEEEEEKNGEGKEDQVSLYELRGAREEGESYVVSKEYEELNHASLNEKKEKNNLYEALTRKRDEELRTKRSLIGPHRDDVSFTVNGHDARRFASQGQQRSIALALKMAEIEILRRVKGAEPLLLLDDVMSELDAHRRTYFVELIRQSSQTVLTTTNPGYFDEDFLSQATVVKL